SNTMLNRSGERGHPCLVPVTSCYLFSVCFICSLFPLSSFSASFGSIEYLNNPMYSSLSGDYKCKVELALIFDGRMTLCYHPSVDIPCEHTKLIPLNRS
ncbi:28S ribosomal protein L42, mitochondrial, partial [Papio anubis]|uniref:28S ribosomal protein L42, mitochondrial n=1 Tax=Papio anubis TaxID=9555 RepID=UPI000B7B856B